MSDASFEEGAERPLFLLAQDPDGLQVLSALVQDAVFPITEMRWEASRRRFAVLLNRFRWEDAHRAEARKRPYERVQSLLVARDVLKVQSQGLERSEKHTVLSLLSLTWEAGDDGRGKLLLTLAGDGALSLAAECLDVTLKDVTRPHLATSGRAPSHE